MTRRFALASVCVMCTLGSGLTRPPAHAAGSAFRVRVLAIRERTSVVIELDEEPVSVKPDRVDASNLVVDVGPITGTIRPRELKPRGVSLLVAVAAAPVSASVNAATTVNGASDAHRVNAAPAGGQRVRVRLTFARGCQTAVRTAGKRVYVDLTPAPVAAPADPREVPRAPGPASRRLLESLGYEELAAPVAEMAAALAKRPDVNALVALRARVVNRDTELGHLAPELVSRILADLDQRLDQARRLRLKLDAAEFERAGGNSRR